jgi:hypothetical protein
MRGLKKSLSKKVKTKELQLKNESIEIGGLL